jgi:phosphoribosylformylglycinamidine synthase
VIFQVEVVVTPKPVVNDPQGLVVRDGLWQLGFSGVEQVRVGKHIALRLNADDESQALASVTQMCEKLLRNPVIEDFRVTVTPETLNLI